VSGIREDPEAVLGFRITRGIFLFGGVVMSWTEVYDFPKNDGVSLNSRELENVGRALGELRTVQEGIGFVTNALSFLQVLPGLVAEDAVRMAERLNTFEAVTCLEALNRYADFLYEELDRNTIDGVTARLMASRKAVKAD
jgi:hypothetical protein